MWGRDLNNTNPAISDEIFSFLNSILNGRGTLYQFYNECFTSFEHWVIVRKSARVERPN